MYKRFSDIIKDLFAAIDLANQEAAKVGGKQITDLNVGSVTRTKLEAFAAVTEDNWFALEKFVNNFFLDTSTGQWMDFRVNDFGMVRKPGARATGQIKIGRDSPSPIGIFVPAGTLFIADDNTEVETVADGVIAVDQQDVTVLAQAKEPGYAGNMPAGLVLKQAGVAIAGIEWAKVVQLGGGADVEADTDLRQRVPDYFTTLARATKKAIEYAAKSVSGVASATLRENDPSPGWFTVYIDDGTAGASPTLIESVRSAVEEYRGFTVHFQVATPVISFVSVSAQVTVQTGVNADAVRQAVSAVIVQYMNALVMGQQVYLAALYRTAMAVSGVENVHITSPAADTDFAENIVPRTSADRVVIS